MELSSRILSQKAHIFRYSSRNLSLMVPIRDIDRRWILAVQTFPAVASGNRVNAIVISISSVLLIHVGTAERAVGIEKLTF